PRSSRASRGTPRPTRSWPTDTVNPEHPTQTVFDGHAGKLVADCWPARAEHGTLLLLHGGGQTRHSWHRSGSRFADAGWTTIALDARGHGDSAWAPDGDYSMDALVSDLATVVAELG